MRLPLLLLPLLLALPAPGSAQGDCRENRLGTVVCRDLPRVPARPRSGRVLPALPDLPEPEAEADRLIPSTRRDAFGIVRPDRRGLTASPRFGEPPRPRRPAVPCRTDAFGNVRCP